MELFYSAQVAPIEHQLRNTRHLLHELLLLKAFGRQEPVDADLFRGEEPGVGDRQIVGVILEVDAEPSLVAGVLVHERFEHFLEITRVVLFGIQAAGTSYVETMADREPVLVQGGELVEGDGVRGVEEVLFLYLFKVAIRIDVLNRHLDGRQSDVVGGATKEGVLGKVRHVVRLSSLVLEGVVHVLLDEGLHGRLVEDRVSVKPLEMRL
mmetsp:Transcript_31697/g.48545  ORF Transcript_31697/g.48545 Transcript_31697/m.48545 type:complete len:209 (-) Transcript_31697:1186-1812(-)